MSRCSLGGPGGIGRPPGGPGGDGSPSWGSEALPEGWEALPEGQEGCVGAPKGLGGPRRSKRCREASRRFVKDREATRRAGWGWEPPEGRKGLGGRPEGLGGPPKGREGSVVPPRGPGEGRDSLPGGRKALRDVRWPSRRGGRGWEASPEGQEWLGGLAGGSGGPSELTVRVGMHPRRARRDREAPAKG